MVKKKKSKRGRRVEEKSKTFLVLPPSSLNHSVVSLLPLLPPFTCLSLSPPHMLAWRKSYLDWLFFLFFLQ